MQRAELYEPRVLFKEPCWVARHSHHDEDEAGEAGRESLTLSQCDVLFEGGVREAGEGVPLSPISVRVTDTRVVGTSHTCGAPQSPLHAPVALCPPAPKASSGTIQG